ncbi:MAG: YCF48-related protein [Patescibacteria group bacterium]
MAKFVLKNIIIIFILTALTGCSFLGLRIGGENKKLANLGDKENIGGILKSINKGETFKFKNQITAKESLNRLDIKALFFDPQDTLTLYLLSKNKGLWVTYNGGENWEILLNELINAVALDHQKRGLIYAAKDTVLLKTEDGGSSWETIFIETLGNAITALTCDPQDSNHLLAASQNGLIFETVDQGESWRLLANLKVKVLRHIIINPQNSAEIYAATSTEGVFKSQDKGRNWSPLSNLEKFPGSYEYGQLKINPANPAHLYLACKYGILKSEDSGEHWQPLSLLTPRGQTKILTVGFNYFNERMIYYATKDSFFRSSDGGLTWSFSSLPTSRYPIEILVDNFDTNVVYIAVSN